MSCGGNDECDPDWWVGACSASLVVALMQLAAIVTIVDNEGKLDSASSREQEQ